MILSQFVFVFVRVLRTLETAARCARQHPLPLATDLQTHNHLFHFAEHSLALSYWLARLTNSFEQGNAGVLARKIVG